MRIDRSREGAGGYQENRYSRVGVPLSQKWMHISSHHRIERSFVDVKPVYSNLPLISGKETTTSSVWELLDPIDEAEDDCIHRETYNRVFSKRQDVHGHVERRTFDNAECIPCGNCVDGCPEKNATCAWARSKQ